MNEIEKLYGDAGLNKINIHKNFKLLLNDENYLKVAEANFTGLKNYITEYEIKKRELLEDFIYKNLETKILQGMKLKIENELLQRKLKEQQ